MACLTLDSGIGFRGPYGWIAHRPMREPRPPARLVPAP
jgi:hypothetical protein